jgi:hypothetical protein
MLHCNVIHISISHNNELMSFISKKFKKFLILQGYLYFFCFFNAFSLGAKKKDLLHVTNLILSLLPFGQNSFISRLF